VGPYTLRAHYGELETSFIRYRQVIARPDLLTIGNLKIPVADVETLALMKAAAVHDRGPAAPGVDESVVPRRRLPGCRIAVFLDHLLELLVVGVLRQGLAIRPIRAAAERSVRHTGECLE
jgi:hypothetical protein